MFSILICVQYYLIILILISLMMNNVESFNWLIAICIFFGEVSLSSSALLQIEFLFLLSFKSSLYHLDMCPLSATCFEIFFSPFVACLFIPIAMSFPLQKCLLFIKFNITLFFLLWISILVLYVKIHY